MQHLVTLCWIGIVALIGASLYNESTRLIFTAATKNYPVIMGFIKFFILASMGELLGRRLVIGKWQLKGIRLFQRALIWGLLGISFTYVFPLFSFGVKFLVSTGRLPAFETGMMTNISIAFWTSLFMNVLFGFEMMVFHRMTDTLIDEGKLFSKWPFVRIWKETNWENIFSIILPTIFWFWLPAHTITFILPPEYRILMASGLGIALGVILSSAKRKAKK